MISVCDAYLLLNTAEELWRNPSDQEKSQTKKAFVEAANAFDLLPSQRRSWIQKAADCYVKGGNHFKAAERYALLGLYQSSVFHFWEAKAINEASSVFCEHRSMLSQDFVAKYESRLRNHYVRLGDFKWVPTRFVCTIYY